MLAEHLKSLLMASDYLHRQMDCSVNVYLVDNTECDDYFNQLQSVIKNISLSDHFNIELLQSPKNRGYGAGNNWVNEQLESEYHLVLNPDVLLSEDALLTSVQYLAEHPTVGMITPHVNSITGYGSHVVKRYPDCLTLLIRFLGNDWLNSCFEKRLQSYACEDLSKENVSVQSVELAGGCFMFLRTGDYLTLNGFDSRYFLYFEDFDFCLRLRRLGVTIDFVPDVKINHSGGDVGRKTSSHHKYFITSAFKFFSCHGWRFW